MADANYKFSITIMNAFELHIFDIAADMYFIHIMK